MKGGTHLALLAKKYERQKVQSGPEDRVFVPDDGNWRCNLLIHVGEHFEDASVFIEAFPSTSLAELEADLAAIGAKDITLYDRGNAITAWVPLSALNELSDMTSLRQARACQRQIHCLPPGPSPREGWQVAPDDPEAEPLAVSDVSDESASPTVSDFVAPHQEATFDGSLVIQKTEPVNNRGNLGQTEDHGDYYWCFDEQILLLRLKHEIVVCVDDPAVLDTLTLPDGPLVGWRLTRKLQNDQAVFHCLEADGAAGPDPSAAVAATSAHPDVAWTAPVFCIAQAQSRVIASNEIIVCLRHGNPEEFFAEGFSSFHRLLGTPDQYVGTLARGGGLDTLAAVEAMRDDPRVVWAEPNFFVELQMYDTASEPAPIAIFENPDFSLSPPANPEHAALAAEPLKLKEGGRGVDDTWFVGPRALSPDVRAGIARPKPLEIQPRLSLHQPALNVAEEPLGPRDAKESVLDLEEESIVSIAAWDVALAEVIDAASDDATPRSTRSAWLIGLEYLSIDGKSGEI
ncbi:MAG: hypothetical protein JW818_17520 [Pirellulales bacterium]|nr:hypothetical protein [Pirellulales bacterium]